MTMKKATKKQAPIYKRLAYIGVLLLAVSAGLFIAWLQPGAVLALFIALALVALVILGESFYLLQVARMHEYNRKNRARRPVQKKEEAQV